jgi:putative phage-type endonuclease
MKRLNLIQGTPEWSAHRAQHFNASDAPAMLGCSPYKTRQQLLHELHTGVTPEVDPSTQRRFDEGHRFEALARPLAEQIIEEPLYPVVGTEGELSASFDGLTMAEDTAFEHKTLNDELRACMKDEGNGYDLPKHYRVQMEQQLLVSGADRVLFMATKWDGEKLAERRHCWYACDPALRAEIVAGWKQFAADLAAYKAPAAVEKIVAAPVETLPAVSVRMDGALTVISNLDKLEPVLRAFIERIPAKPSTDQEFADTDAACKALKRIEDELDAAEASALASLDAVEQMQRLKKTLHALARSTRLQREKLVEARKVEIRAEEVARGKQALAEFITGLNATIGKPYMPTIAADFAGAIRGRKTVQSLRDAVDQELARAKIEASTVCGRIVINMRALRELAAEHAFLFADTATLVLKAEEDCRAQIDSRIAAHRAQEERRLEAERARIRAEEQARADREAQERVAAEQRQREEANAEVHARARAEKEALDAEERREQAALAETLRREVAAPAANVVPMPTKARPPRRR